MTTSDNNTNYFNRIIGRTTLPEAGRKQFKPTLTPEVIPENLELKTGHVALRRSQPPSDTAQVRGNHASQPVGDIHTKGRDDSRSRSLDNEPQDIIKKVTVPPVKQPTESAEAVKAMEVRSPLTEDSQTTTIIGARTNIDVKSQEILDAEVQIMPSGFPINKIVKKASSESDTKINNVMNLHADTLPPKFGVPEKIGPAKGSQSIESFDIVDSKEVKGDEEVDGNATISVPEIHSPKGVEEMKPRFVYQIGSADRPQIAGGETTTRSRQISKEKYAIKRRDDDPSETVFTINIGRVEVRAVTPTSSADIQSRTPRFSPSLSLAEYLKRRAEGKGS